MKEESWDKEIEVDVWRKIWEVSELPSTYNLLRSKLHNQILSWYLSSKIDQNQEGGGKVV